MGHILWPTQEANHGRLYQRLCNIKSVRLQGITSLSDGEHIIGQIYSPAGGRILSLHTGNADSAHIHIKMIIIFVPFRQLCIVWPIVHMCAKSHRASLQEGQIGENVLSLNKMDEWRQYMCFKVPFCSINLKCSCWPVFPLPVFCMGRQ